MSIQVPLFNKVELKPSKADACVAEVVDRGFDVKEFVENFEVLSQSVNGPRMIRGLILGLATRGLLVRQNESERSLATALAAIPTDLPPVDAGSEPFAVPTTWCWARLGHAAEYNAGERVEPAQIADGAWLLELEDIEPQTSVLLAVVTAGARQPRSSKSKFQPADVLYGKLRPYLDKVIVATRPGYCTTEIAPVRGRGLTDPEFLRLTLKRPDFVSYANSSAYGMNLPRLGTDAARNALIPIPPIREQKRIVAKVDQLMAICDDLEGRQAEKREIGTRLTKSALEALTTAEGPEEFDAAWKRVVENFDVLIDQAEKVGVLRAIILQLAVIGKLVAHVGDAAHEGMSSAGGGGDDTRIKLPTAWRWVKLGQVSELINGDRSKSYPNRAEYVQEGVAWINTGHIEPDGTLSLALMHYISRKKFDSLRSGKVRPGDLVYCLRGATLGKTAIITQFTEGAVASSLVIIRLSPAVDPAFAYRVLTSPLGREQIFRFDNGSAQPNLSANSVKKYSIPLPPLDEQRRIVAKVGQLMKVCDELEAKLRRAEDRAAKLVEAAVQELVVGR